MDKIKELLVDEFDFITVESGFNRELLAKDYYITILLYLMKDIRGIYFKGGTALQKTILNYSRISEDIDFTTNRKLPELMNEIVIKIRDSEIFGKISKDKDVPEFTRLIVPYNTNISKGTIFIDLNEKGNILLEPKRQIIKHFYSNISEFNFLCLDIEEMVAEKVSAAIKRNKPRDHYDIYQIIKHKIPINNNLVKQKCKLSGCEHNIQKMFNKAKKLHKRWNKDIESLLINPVSFQEIMKTLSIYFDLKNEKEKIALK